MSQADWLIRWDKTDRGRTRRRQDIEAMSTRERWLATIAFWFALPSPCLAHRPYVEPWMHAASISLAAALGITTALLLRRKAGIVVAVGVGLVVSLLGSFAGWVASMVLSM